MKMIRFAIDLGTTTVDCCLYDEENEIVISSYSYKNPQSLYGRDVIERINATIKHKSNLAKLRKLIVDSIKDAFSILIDKSGILTSDVYKTVISGNTTMESILLGIDITNLGSYPFEYKLTETILCKQERLDMNFFDNNTEFLITKCASAFIGGDILSGLSYIEKTYPDNNNYLLLDLGTNGEIVLHKDEEYIGTSASCGPAFENCTRKQNIYGNSVIDAIAMCMDLHHINQYGTLSDDYIDNGLNIMNIHIDMDIIRNIIMAKAAIRTGIDMLIKKAGCSYDDINTLYIAGGFGFYLNIHNAVKIGLIPGELKDKIIIVGNSSLKGATKLKKGEIDKYNIKVLSLALMDEYENELIGNMILGDNNENSTYETKTY